MTKPLNLLAPVTVTIVADSEPISYSVGTSNSASIVLFDDISIPNLTIPETSGNFEENSSPSFKLKLTRTAFAREFNIYASIIEEVGDFLPNSITENINQYKVFFRDPDGDMVYDGEISIPLVDDSIGEVNWYY